jgi:hypothetical protein
LIISEFVLERDKSARHDFKNVIMLFTGYSRAFHVACGTYRCCNAIRIFTLGAACEVVGREPEVRFAAD